MNITIRKFFLQEVLQIHQYPALFISIPGIGLMPIMLKKSRLLLTFFAGLTSFNPRGY